MNIEEHIKKEIFNTFNIDLDNAKSTITDVIKKLQGKRDLSENDVIIAMSSLMSLEISQDDIAAYLTALHEKGETIEEIATSARVMRIFASKVYTRENKKEFEQLDLLDCCGTGGGINVFNISTAVALIVAAGGVSVAKHGNRAITSRSGSADVLEALGVKIDIPQSKVGECILKVGIGFLFAPLFHKATKNVQQVRRTLLHKTIFNILGPLTNPTEPSYQVIGVYHADLTERFAHVLKLLGLKRACVVHGFTPCGGGMDEISTLGQTKVSELMQNGDIKNYFFRPQEIGIPDTTRETLQGGDAHDNASLIRNILSGDAKGAQEEIVVLNTAFAFMVCGRVKHIKDGIKLSRDLIANGACRDTLEKLITFTNNG